LAIGQNSQKPLKKGCK